MQVVGRHHSPVHMVKYHLVVLHCDTIASHILPHGRCKDDNVLYIVWY